MKFEYLVRHFKAKSRTPEQHQQFLTEQGDLGWELSHVASSCSGILFIFKREKTCTCPDALIVGGICDKCHLDAYGDR